MNEPDLPNSILTERFQMGLPSRPHWIEPTVEYLQQRALLCGACEETRMNRLTVSLHEALTNAMIHGNLGISSQLKEQDDDSFAETLARRAADPELADRVVDVAVAYDGEQCTWTITDQGNGFDFHAVVERAQSDDPELLLASGRGVMIMLSFMDQLRYELGGRRLVLTLNRESGQEKRRYLRRHEYKKIEVAPIRPDGTVDWEAAYEAVSRNLSEDGIALFQEQLEASQRILIGIIEGDKPVYIPARVRRIRALADDFVELGCQFQREPLPKTDKAEIDVGVGAAIEGFLQQRREPASPEDNRRSYQRVAFTERIEILPGRDKKPIAGFARDLSKGGIAFIANVSLPNEIVICFAKKLEGQEVRVRAKVVRSTEVHHGFYDVAARFISLEDASGG